MCGTVSVEATRDQQLGCCLATELGIDCELVSTITPGAVTSLTVGLLTRILSGVVSVCCTACGNSFGNYQAFSDLSLYISLHGVVKYIF